MRLKLLMIAVISLPIIVIATIALKMDWTPKEQRMAEIEASYHQEISGSAKSKVEEVKAESSVEPKENNSTEEAQSDSVTMVNELNAAETNQGSIQIEKSQENDSGKKSSTKDHKDTVDDSTMADTKLIDESLLISEKEPDIKPEVEVVQEISSGTDLEVSTVEEDQIVVAVPKIETDDTDEPTVSNDSHQTENKKTGSSTIVKDQWVQEKIDANIDKIDSSDLTSGAEIYNKLDTSYLLEIAEGGLTEDEKNEVQQYLDSKLSPSEKDQLWNLYQKYVHLVE